MKYSRRDWYFMYNTSWSILHLLTGFCTDVILIKKRTGNERFISKKSGSSFPHHLSHEVFYSFPNCISFVILQQFSYLRYCLCFHFIERDRYYSDFACFLSQLWICGHNDQSNLQIADLVLICDWCWNEISKTCLCKSLPNISAEGPYGWWLIAFCSKVVINYINWSQFLLSITTTI